MAASRDFVRRTGSPPIEHVIPGAQLVVCYAVYRHCGIYTGGGRVIHYAGWIRGRRGLIEEIPLDEFTEGREFEVNQSPPDLFSGRDVVRRARSRLGERCYDLLENNCEHFCSWCQLGEARSVQIELMAKPLRLAIAALQALWSAASILSSESSAGGMRSR
jgi:Lecithin retinol acyltransferase